MSLYAKKLGIIGGGQISQMLTQRARQMGFEVTILSEDKDDPAVSFANLWFKGSINDENSIKALTALCDIVTYESEFISARHLAAAQKKFHSEIYPLPEHLAILQDRWSQKELLWDHQIPTAEFIKIASKDELSSALTVFKSFVLKKRRGKNLRESIYFIHSKAELDHFLLHHKNNETQYIIEKQILFKSEKTLIMGRNLKGEVFAYPLIHVQHKNNQCFRVWGPEKHPKLDHLLEKLTYLLHKLNYCGLITFELFDTGSDLLVNQIIPRPHNAGFVTQDTFSLDQFELHLRAISNLSFPDELHSTQYFLMQNIIGESTRVPHLTTGLKGKLHWYNKKTNKPLKKLGHVNYFGSSIKNLIKNADADLKKITISLVLLFLISSCGIKTNSSSETYSYQFNVNGCDTTKREFSSLDAMCAALNDNASNYYCAYNERYQKFLADCSGKTWNP